MDFTLTPETFPGVTTALVSAINSVSETITFSKISSAFAAKPVPKN